MASTDSTLTDVRQAADRFWGGVAIDGDGCWLWTRARSAFKGSTGYGVIRIRGRNFLTHRVAYTLVIGVIPEGACVLHRCDNPPCVRPDHLFLGSRTDNAADKVRKRRQSFTPGPLGEASHRAKLTWRSVVLIRDAYRNGVRMLTLARRFGVSHRTIGRVVHGLTWPAMATPRDATPEHRNDGVQ